MAFVGAFGTAEIVSAFPVWMITFPLIHGTITPSCSLSSLRICCTICSFVSLLDDLSDIVSDNFSNNHALPDTTTTLPDPFAS